MQSVPITTKVVNSNPADGEVYSIQHYVIQFVSDVRHVWFSPGIPVASTNKTDRHDITEIFFESGIKHHNPNHNKSQYQDIVGILSLMELFTPHNASQKPTFDILRYQERPAVN